MSNKFSDSYLGKLRKQVGTQLLLVPGARIIIQNPSKEILLQLRADFKIWGLPAGSAEPGDDITATIIREVKEETSLKIIDPKPFGYSSNPQTESITYPNGDKIQCFNLDFYCTKYEGTPMVADDESLALNWFPLENLPELLPNMATSIKAYQRFLATGEFQIF